MTAMQCQLDIPKVEGLKDQELTVGREFYLSCTGDWPKNLVQEKLHLEIPPANKYQIQLLGFEFRSPERADIKVTAHKTGEVKFENLKLTDGAQTIELGPVTYQVQTVIEKPQDPQAKVEPFGAIGPAGIAIPLAYILALAVVILFLGLWLARRLYRYSQRRTMLAKLKEHDSALAPLQQFHQRMRKLQRDNPIFFGSQAVESDIAAAFEELDQMFRLYLVRELHVPALSWGDNLILADIKKYHKTLYKEQAVDFKKLLREFTQSAKNKKTLGDKDILVLADHSRRLVEKIDRHLRTSKKPAGGGTR